LLAIEIGFILDETTSAADFERDNVDEFHDCDFVQSDECTL